MRYVIIALLHLATMTTADAQWFRQSGGTCANGSCSQGSGVQFASPTIPPFSAGLTAAEPVNRLVWEFKAGDKSTLVLKVDGYTFGELNTRTLVFTGARGEKWDLSDAIPRTIPQAMPGKKDAGQPCKGFAGNCLKCGGACKCDPCKCDEFLPKEEAPAPRFMQLPPTGVARERMTSDGTHKYTVNGKREDGETFFNALLSATGDNLVDDSGKYLLCVMGDVASCNKIRADFIGSELVAKCNFKTYRPTHPVVSDFKPAGSPTIVLQSPTGRVLWRQDNYEGGMNALAENASQIFAQYDPAKDPGPGKPFPWAAPPKPVDPPKNPDPPKTPDPTKPDPVPTPAPAPTLNVNTLLILAILAGIGFHLYKKKGSAS
jgi:hypothetical protein